MGRLHFDGIPVMSTPLKYPVNLRASCDSRPTAVRRWITALAGALVLTALAACNGNAVVTLTATPSTDTFLAYRVGLVSVQLQSSSGIGKSTNVLPSGTTVDLARLVNLSEVMGSSSAKTGSFKQAVVTLDYSSAQIVYDDGTPEGVALAPRGAGGGTIGQVTVTLLLDPSSPISIARSSSTRLSLDFNLAASNLVNLSAKTVTVMPMMAASSVPIDSKTVRIRGPLGSVSTSNNSFSLGVVPFDFPTSEAGSLQISTSTGTSYEINGTPTSSGAGLSQLAALSASPMTEAFGTLTTSTSTSSSVLGQSTSTTPTETCSDGTTPETVNGILECTDGATLETNDQSTTAGTGSVTTVSFSATQVLAGSSVQGGGFDRISGIVTGRSGDTLTIDDGTLLTASGTNSLISGTSTVLIGPNTEVTQFGSASTQTIPQISVGSLIYAFGTASDVSASTATVDASAGHVRLGQSSASGIVTALGSGGTSVTLNLTQLGGRSPAAFDFAGTGTAGNDASPSSYIVGAAGLSLSNATAGLPVTALGYVQSFGSGSPNFNATSIEDYTTINAELVLDWTGTTAPFAAYSTSQIQLAATSAGVGARHLIQVGAQTFNLLSISDVYIVPSETNSNLVFTIGHSVSGTCESFNTFSAFITQLQTELTGSVVATGITATGPYTSSTYTLSASSITLFLDN